MDKSRFTYDNPEQNKVIKRIIDESAWNIGMLKEFVFEGEYLRKYLLSNKIFDWRVIRDLSWALRCSPEKLTGKDPGVMHYYYSAQPVYPAIMTYTSNNMSFRYLTRQEIADYAHIIGVPAYIIEYMRYGDAPLYCTEHFAKLFTKRFNSACPGSDILLGYFFSKAVPQDQKKAESNNSNYLTSFIKSIEDSDLSGSDLMKLARYCELEAKKKELLSSINN